ncbi:MAG: type II toxin-antitoxin system mRNA interferase toxin, RelE/StbE family [Gammaproteobacteria bacterium]|nr:type II toxin-antitoxin system mRNA interferase toxin, RelE/StbE family [Gammaproteobacteria bacterium]
MKYHPQVKEDLQKLGHITALLILKKVQKLADNPYSSVELGNKANMDLTGYRKVYIDNKRVRIVYKVIESELQVFVVATGKRDDMKVYQKVSDRI